MDFNELLCHLNVNTKEVLDRFSGNQILLKRFICKFPSEKTYLEFKSAFEAGEKENEKIAVHTLKGISANLGFETLYTHCSDFLEDIRGNQENIEAEFKKISSEYERVTNLILKFSADTNNK